MKPNWKHLGLNSKAEGMAHVMNYLFKHKDSIIARGFSPEVRFYVGDNEFILKGKNPGRKKDK